MSDEIKMSPPTVRWEVEVRWPLVHHAPLVVDPLTEQTVDPHGLDLTFTRFDEWRLTLVEVYGSVVLPDGTYPDDGDITCVYYDTNPDEAQENGGHPDWVAPIAEQVLSQLPAAPVTNITISYPLIESPVPTALAKGPMVRLMEEEGLL